MKKRVFVFMIGVGALFTTCNVCKVFSQVSLSDLFLKQIEAVAVLECSSYEYEHSSLVPTSRYCNKHKATHSWSDCVTRTDDRCCDSRAQSAKPTCVE